MILNPNCSEAVFRLDGKVWRVETDYGESIENFVKKLAKSCPKDPFRSYKFIRNEGGGANVLLLESLICLASLYKRNIISKQKFYELAQQHQFDRIEFLRDFINDEFIGAFVRRLIQEHEYRIRRIVIGKKEKINMDKKLGEA